MVIDITDGDNINELIQSETQILDIRQKVSTEEIADDLLTKVNEAYGNVQKSIIFSIEHANGSSLLLWKSEKNEKFLSLELNFNLARQIGENLSELTVKFIKKSLTEGHLGKSIIIL